MLYKSQSVWLKAQAYRRWIKHACANKSFKEQRERGRHGGQWMETKAQMSIRKITTDIYLVLHIAVGFFYRHTASKVRSPSLLEIFITVFPHPCAITYSSHLKGQFTPSKSVIIYSRSYCSKPAWISFLSTTQRKIFCRKLRIKTFWSPLF